MLPNQPLTTISSGTDSRLLKALVRKYTDEDAVAKAAKEAGYKDIYKCQYNFVQK